MQAGWLDEIRLDNTSGAAELCVKAARGLTAWAESAGFSRELLVPTARALAEAQPRMAPIFNLANEVLLRGPEHIASTCRAFIERLERANKAAGAAAAGLIPDGGTVLTHSFSSAVLRALRKARAEGKQFGVVCTESRPVREGVALARELGASGVPVRLIADAAVALFLPEASLVLVGADAVTAGGVVNKIGTAPLAALARIRRIEMYALCGSEKFFPSDCEPPREKPRNPREILDAEIPGVAAVNYYFDLTPLEHLAGVITEEGVLGPEDVRRRAAALEVHEALRTLDP